MICPEDVRLRQQTILETIIDAGLANPRRGLSRRKEGVDNIWIDDAGARPTQTCLQETKRFLLNNISGLLIELPRTSYDFENDLNLSIYLHYDNLQESLY